MKVYQRSFIVAASLEKVAAFHSDSRVLKRLSPPPIVVHIHRTEPLTEGSQTEFTLWLGPLPVRWLAVHRQVEPLAGFVDEQARGPFRRWVHRHEFQARGQTETEVTDGVESEFGDAGLDWLVSRMIWLGVPLLFAYRAWRTRRALEG